MKLLFYLITFLLITTAIRAQPGEPDTGNHSVYKADPGVQVHDLKNYASVFIDSSNKLTIQEVASEKFAHRFQPFPDTARYAQPYITYWLKLSIVATGDIQNWWLFVNGDPQGTINLSNSYVDGWFLNSGNQVIEHQRTGLFVPRSQKTVRESPGLNRILFSAKSGETKNIYLRIYNEFDPGFISTPQLRNPIAGFTGKKDLSLIFGSGGAFFFLHHVFHLFLFCQGEVLPLFWILCVHSVTTLSYSPSRYSFY